MLGIAGTIPIEDLPLLTGGVTMENGNIRIDGRSIPVDRGTAALIGAAVKTAEVLGTALPRGIIVGDIGRGAGSITLYKYLVDTFAESGFHTCTFHYLQPDVFWHNNEWIELWTCWLNYQRSINNFRNSFDFNKMTE